jgi:alginate O-acetyltransferase complex protein AlgI
MGMVGLAFVLHFGTFHFLSLLYRWFGIDAPHIFRAPALASSVADLWGSRWNLAFRDLAHRFIFRPLAKPFGIRAASLATFALSGLIHELVISLPIGAGYGQPTAYFLVQWFGIAAERSALGKRLGLRRGFGGRLFACIIVAGPVGLLFHGPFVRGVMIPFLRAIGVEIGPLGWEPCRL